MDNQTPVIANYSTCYKIDEQNDHGNQIIEILIKDDINKLGDLLFQLLRKCLYNILPIGGSYIMNNMNGCYDVKRIIGYVQLSDIPRFAFHV